MTGRVQAGPRGQKNGPEDGLLDRFLSSFSFGIPRGCDFTYFREPRLESGFPDLVCVIWSHAVARRWTPERLSLTRFDLQLLQLLVTVGSSGALPKIPRPKGTLQASFERLFAASMLKRRKGSWEPRTMQNLFAVRDIVAVEAKISDSGEAVSQAQLNTWFASRSYVLVPKVPSRGRLVAAVRLAGVGLISEEDFTGPVLEAEELSLPRSYASWVFNEWVCRLASGT